MIFDPRTWLTTLILSSLMGCLGMGAMGCRTSTQGGTEIGLGYRSETKVFVYHDTEEGNKSKSESATELSQPLSDWLFDSDGNQIASPADETIIAPTNAPATTAGR